MELLDVYKLLWFKNDVSSFHLVVGTHIATSQFVSDKTYPHVNMNPLLIVHYMYVYFYLIIQFKLKSSQFPSLDNDYSVRTQTLTTLEFGQ